MSDLDKLLSQKDNFEKAISAIDICKIIRACALNGVSTLKYSSLEVSFKSHQKLEISGDKPVSSNSTAQVQQIPREIIAMQDEESEKSFLSDTIAIREQQLSEMLINEPEKFEELQSLGELEDVQAENDIGT